MHAAMHDALNAADPVYARWHTARAGEPAAPPEAAEAAMVGAAHEVLFELHPADRDDLEGFYTDVLGALPPGEATRSGLALGQVIGADAVQRRRDDGYAEIYAFPAGSAPGQWRPTAPVDRPGNTTRTRPFLRAERRDPDANPPPALGSAEFVARAAEIRDMGALDSSGRTPEQTYAAYYWAYQSSQRGFVLLAVQMLDDHPRPGGLAAEARFMSQLTAAMADSAVLAWSEKEQFSYWRPVTALNSGGGGIDPVPGWTPLIETPQHPEHPSGHATDCYTGAGMLATAFPDAGPIRYVAQSALPPPELAATGMGQHAQAGTLTEAPRRFATLAAAAQECADSRIWAGAHFRSANDEGRRLAGLIVAGALAAVPPQ